MKGGRPFRFLATTLGLWIGARVILLWPQLDSAAKVMEAIVPPAAALAIAPEPPPATRRHAVALPSRPANLSTAPPQNLSTGSTPLAPSGSSATPPHLRAVVDPAPPLLLPERPPAHGAARARWSASGWLILRGGAPRADAAQLGGSQLGGRIGYALDDARRVALSVRAMAPMRGRGAEIAAGLDWQPGPAPVHVLVEKRIAVDGGRDGASVTLVAGLDPTRIAGEWRLEAYGQAGAIARDGSAAAGFGDGAARLSRPVTRGATRLDLGIGLWGGMQRGAARLDLGPSLAVVVPAGEHRLRVTLDWRQRVAGNAAPGSGPALSVGTDF
ncbi:hypothetical protein [Sphingomonas abaci]|uniref:Uncharacterized protein n=1 Tax=Sphingomonas abaci TaxID=237611 RepID=A0A7W7AL10_9SPHN|nr:hypothetical protein [Sphingomonas abaci]